MKINLRIQQLFDLHLSQSATEMEREEFWGYVNDPVYGLQIQQLISDEYENGENQQGLNELERQAVLLQIFGNNDDLEESVVLNNDKKSFKLWPRIVAVAAAVMFMVLGIYFFNNNFKVDNGEPQIVNQDVAPGSFGATLTLANGKTIKLSDVSNGELAKEAGVVITKSADGKLEYEIKGSDSDPNKINTLSTAKGETYKVRLPDGSLVYLNAASSLTYPVSLNERGRRVVKLRGEGYFEIFKDKAHPFIVETDKQEIEVLGTHFNVNSYKDETATITTLIEGSVKVTDGKNKQILKPGEQALNNGSTIQVSLANIDNITDWKDGDFYFNRVDFRTAMRKVARWYDVEIIYDSTVPENIETGGWISRDKKLSKVLKFIESLGDVHFRIEGKKVFVSK